jgi:hypothetical protein
LRHLPGDVGGFLASQLAQAAEADLFQSGDDGRANSFECQQLLAFLAENGMELLLWLAGGLPAGMFMIFG